MTITFIRLYVLESIRTNYLLVSVWGEKNLSLLKETLCNIQERFKKRCNMPIKYFTSKTIFTQTKTKQKSHLGLPTLPKSVVHSSNFRLLSEFPCRRLFCLEILCKYKKRTGNMCKTFRTSKISAVLVSRAPYTLLTSIHKSQCTISCNVYNPNSRQE